jgi:hypothetical protein
LGTAGKAFACVGEQLLVPGQLQQRIDEFGRFREAAAGEVEPRTVLILVEWASKEAFESYRNDPKLADLHPHRVNGTSDYIWHLFDKLDDLRPLLK